MARIAEQVWYRGHPLALWLAPLGWLYCLAAMLRALAYRRGWLRSQAAGVPVIVVGNLTVGGSGKTPLVIWLVAELGRRGLRPGIASRGYRGRGGDGPIDVAADSNPAWAGDEPVLLAGRTGRPVVVARDRVAAARRLVQVHGCDIVVTDDGLQHYRLRRDLEILVIDGGRGLGNGRCLPAGPLREPARRAQRADLVIVTGAADDGRPVMRLEPSAAVRLGDPARRQGLETFRDRRVTAVAGIGHPERFFTMLRRHGLEITPLAYPDHHWFSAGDIARWGPGPVLMTEKDAVKLRPDAPPDVWVVPVSAWPDARFRSALQQALGRIAAQGAGAHGSAGG